MLCNEVRELLMAGEVTEQVDQHTADCAECAALRNTVLGLTDLAKSWTEEPVPHWQRVPEEMRRRPRGSAWLTWAPLAACLLMCVLVVTRANLSWDDKGFQLSFGTPPAPAPASARCTAPADRPPTSCPSWPAGGGCSPRRAGPARRCRW